MKFDDKTRHQLLNEVNELRLNIASLIKTESQYRHFIENIPQKIFYKDINSIYVAVNTNYAKDFNALPSDLIGKSDYDIFPPTLAEKYGVDDRQIMQSGKTVDYDENYISGDEERSVHTVKGPVFDDNGKVIGILGIFWDITDRKRKEDKLRTLSEKDPLTRIYNRRKLFELLEREVKKAQRYTRPLSLVMFDFDHFKKINDGYGHAIGDVVLRTTAHIISNKIRVADIFARYGGEEFIIVCPETALEGAFTLAEKIRVAVERHIYTDIGPITISAGVAAHVNGDNSGITLIKRADTALYIAKDRGRNRVETAGATPEAE